jgi:alpha/beta superfamily hydrolase
VKKSEAKKRGCRYVLNLLLAALGGLLLVGCVVAYGVLPVSHARRIARPDRWPLYIGPGEFGILHEDVSFPTADGLTLHGWYLPSHNGAAVIAAHPVGVNRTSLLPQAAALAEAGYGVLLLDLRAHGASDGETTSFDGADVEAAAAYLAGRADVDPERIGALGLSLGACVAIEAAARTPQIKAVVADGAAPVTFRDVPTPHSLAHWLDLPFQWVSFQVWEREGTAADVPLIEAIASIEPRPILLISGVRSGYENVFAHELLAAAPSAALWEIPETGHIGGWSVREDEYRARMITFFDQALLADNLE